MNDGWNELGKKVPQGSSSIMLRLMRSRCFSSSTGNVSTVGIVGLGLMGHGIAQVAAEKGFAVVAVETEQRFLDGGMKRIEGSVQKIAAKAVKKGKMTEADAGAAASATLGRLTPTTDMSALASCDVVIEAVIEDIELKERLYGALGSVVSDDCIIASNTSSLPIAKMAAFCGRPSQTVGLHFFNPVQLMQLVEVRLHAEHFTP